MTYRTYFSKKILITSGPTRAPLDAVRFLSNRSTGRFGTLLAEVALQRGADVTMVYGAGSETPRRHPRLRLVPIETNRDLQKALQKLLRQRHDAVIHAMAVLDFEPVRVLRGKVASRHGDWEVRLRPTEKIINQIKQWAPQTYLVGFKLETKGGSLQRLLNRGRRLLKESKADLVIANCLTEGDDRRHAGYLIDREGNLLKKIVGKGRLAREIIRGIL